MLMIHGIRLLFLLSSTGTQVIRVAKTNSADFQHREGGSPLGNKVLV